MSESQPTPPPGDAPRSDEVRNGVEAYQRAFRGFLESRGMATDNPETAATKGAGFIIEITPDDTTLPKNIQLPTQLEELLTTFYKSTPIVIDKLVLSLDRATIEVKQGTLPGEYQTLDDQIFNMDRSHIDEPGYATKVEFDFTNGVYKTGRGFQRDAMTREERIDWIETPLNYNLIYGWRDIASYADHIPNTQTQVVNKRLTPLPSRDMPYSFKANSINSNRTRK